MKMRQNNQSSIANYGISRMDCETNNIHAWRVSLRRHGKRHVKNFPDKRCGGKKSALSKATEYRDELLVKYPPLSRKEYCNVKRRNNKTGIVGVYKYRKTYKLKNGTIKESWYWEANWPDRDGDSISESFPVNRFGDELAKQKAINARDRGMQTVNGAFWAAERGLISPA